MDCAGWLSAAGAAGEIGGLALIVLDIRDSMRAAQEVLRHRVVKELAMAYDIAEPQPIRPAPPPTLEERVALLDRELTRVEEESKNRDRKLADDLGQRVAVARQSALEEDTKRDAALRKFLATQLGSGVGRRLTGVGLVFGGVVLSALANMVC